MDDTHLSLAEAAMAAVDRAVVGGWPDPLVAALALDADADAHALMATAAVLGGALCAAQTSPGVRRGVARQLVFSGARCAAEPAPGMLGARVQAARTAVAEGSWQPGVEESPPEVMGALFGLVADAAGSA